MVNFSDHRAASRTPGGGGRRFVEVFDRVNHDVLMGKLAKRIEDKLVLGLTRRYLEAGILATGVVIERHEGTPQGGPLSPLLANILLDEVDQTLEQRGHALARYADDLNVYVRSKRSERVLNKLRRLLGKLRLVINEEKSAVGSVFTRQFLGFSLWVAAGKTVEHRVSKRALQPMRTRVRQLTRRSCGAKLIADRRKASELLGWLEELLPTVENSESVS